MKKIIFDLDNTLINFDSSYFEDYASVINGTLADGKKLYKIIGEYEKLYHLYDERELTNFINSKMNYNYDSNLIDRLNYVISTRWIKSVPNGLDDVLYYLYQKYDLYVLTNWFTECQKRRLENVNILKYFKEVVGNDKYLSKPNKDGYLHIIGNTNLCDVVMIGDNFDIDIKGANNVKIKSILYDYQNVYGNVQNKIKDLRKLKEML